MSKNPYLGWELLMKLVEKDIKSAADILFALVHWVMIKHNFSCLGLGDDKEFRSPEERGSEVLPENWNMTDQTSLRYRHSDELFILHSVILSNGSTSLFNLLNASKGCVANISFDIADTIHYCREKRTNKIHELFPKAAETIGRIRVELINTVVPICRAQTSVDECEPLPNHVSTSTPCVVSMAREMSPRRSSFQNQILNLCNEMRRYSTLSEPPVRPSRYVIPRNAFQMPVNFDRMEPFGRSTSPPRTPFDPDNNLNPKIPDRDDPK